IKIYTLIGELVWEEQFSVGAPESEAGFHEEVMWDGRNDAGEIVRNGVYVCKIETDHGSAMTKIAVAK
ncbi:hypothetical protein AMJ40_06865, partial [candidate division TA06 bacterium DG_26]